MFKEADFTLWQASFQAVLPTEEDVSTVNDTCPKNKQFSCTVKYKRMKGMSSWSASRYTAWGLGTSEQPVLQLRSGPDSPRRITLYARRFWVHLFWLAVLWYLLLNCMDEYKCNYSVLSILFLSYLIHNSISSGGGEWNNHYHYLIEWASFGSLFPEQTSWFVTLHGDWFFVQPQSVLIWARM